MADKKNNSKKNSSGFADSALNFLSVMFRSFAGSFLFDLRDKTKMTVGRLVKKTIAGAVLVVGVFFLLTGLSKVIGKAIGYGDGAGYAIVGALVVLAALVSMTLIDNKK